jgi:hypothetical protein
MPLPPSRDSETVAEVPVTRKVLPPEPPFRAREPTPL